MILSFFFWLPFLPLINKKNMILLIGLLGCVFFNQFWIKIKKRCLLFKNNLKKKERNKERVYSEW